MYELARKVSTPLQAFNFELSMETLNTALAVLKKSVDTLKDQSFAKSSPAEVAKIANHMSKAIDDMARLMSFMQGGPDSRPDLGLDSVFALLNIEQVKTLEMWLGQSGAWETTLNQPLNEEKPS